MELASGLKIRVPQKFWGLIQNFMASLKTIDANEHNLSNDLCFL